MSSSGLIYAVIVGAWAAYLVPMWLRRQDELNEARPTERFGTAIRLLSGRAAMERRCARELEAAGREEGDLAVSGAVTDDDATSLPADGVAGVDVRALADPVTEHHEILSRTAITRAEAPTQVRPHPERAGGTGRGDRDDRADDSGRRKRARLLARRRRTTMGLFLAFTLGAVVAAVGGVAFLWAPAIPAGLLSAYIAHLRAQERRRFVVVMDRRRAEAAARRLRENRAAAPPAAPKSQPKSGAGAGAEAAPAPAPVPDTDPRAAAERRALVEQTDHAEWVDSQRRERAPGSADGGWEPTPVPLPTYVNAPVAPRTAGGVDLDAPDAWSSARSATAPTPAPAQTPTSAQAPAAPSGRSDRSRSDRSSSRRSQTPLFDQYADEDRPRAANE
ncbi:hypothetical protein CUT44_11410 [Streptomyces carminius]|uniref:Uncharacterized protein n=1 Tax=Streptomyces carminius TaxID=2665496 RepID=A0A2M8LYG6_9ACTN|nr:gephyrin-like molybdotransferase receptor GlpR [Streptomyces carminius]PJE97017.1 hypothetical protein CUT44_14665 [Streptomyces carminius]PJE97726.1 hypothetical protein CUT44_11410 [Streptomyces carminius]